jgi:acyl-CoA thioester hydrolase
MSETSDAAPPRPWVYRHRVGVRFRDCDAMGHVNHAVYFTYFEQCRLHLWRELTGAAHPHTRVVIARAECDYRAPAHFGDDLDVSVRIGSVGRTSFVLEYQIARSGTDSLVIAIGKTVMVAYDRDAARSIALPDATRTLLESLRRG